jgi:hypothetical protein
LPEVVPLISPDSAVSLERLGALRTEFLEELKEMEGMFGDSHELPGARRLRARTAQELVTDALALGRSSEPGSDRLRLIAELNLFYDTVVVASEYFRLFVKPRPYPQRPAEP